MKGVAVGFFSHRFYDGAENERVEIQGSGFVTRDPRERFIDRPAAAPQADFNRGVDLDG